MNVGVEGIEVLNEGVEGVNSVCRLCNVWKRMECLGVEKGSF